MIGWRKNSWNPERVSSVFTFVSVCVSVCTRATVHTFWSRNLIFGLSDPLDMRKKTTFFFEIFIFTLFISIFRFFPLYNTSKFLPVFLSAGYRAHLLTYESNFWVEWSLGHEKKTHFFGFRNFHFYAFHRHFSIFSLYNTSKFLVSSYRSQFFT